MLCCWNRPRRSGRHRRRRAVWPLGVCGAARTDGRASAGGRSGRSDRRPFAAAARRCAGGRPARPRAPVGRPAGPWDSAPVGRPAGPWDSAPGTGAGRWSASRPRNRPTQWPPAGPRPTAPASGCSTRAFPAAVGSYGYFIRLISGRYCPQSNILWELLRAQKVINWPKNEKSIVVFRIVYYYDWYRPPPAPRFANISHVEK